MDFKKTENQEMIAQMCRDFAEKEIRPHFMDWDESQEFPVQVFKKLGELGLMGVLVPEAYGGSGMSYYEYITAIDEISQVCGSIGLSVAAHNSLCTGHILQFGNEEQKKKYLPKLATAEWIGAWGLTETGTGSDAGGMNTTAVLDGDHYVINGSKNFITHAISGDVAVVMVRTGDKGDSHGMSALIVEKGTPGFSGGKKENKLGMRASETAGLFLDGGRISIGALSLGIARGAYLAALKYSKEREQFGQPISSFQAIGFKLADMAMQIEASELMLFKAAYLKETGQKMTKEGTIGEGTSEIQKLVISRQVIGK